ncbi:MAG: alpha/beta hydrolase [Deltaproteobacteria bacterium]
MIPSLFLAVTLVGALATLNAYRPLVRRGRLAVVGFFAGWLVSELPVHHVAWQVLFTVGFVRRGALHGWPGELGMGITLASWFGLIYLVVVARGARSLLADALSAGLGADHAARIVPSMREPADVHFTWRRLLQPFELVGPGVERIANIPYDPRHGRRGMLNVYRRADAPQGRPVLLEVHGGAWMIGSKDDQALPLMNHLASQGWVCVTINYRLSPRATWPDHIVDVKRAIAWVKEHVGEYGGDPRFIAITGGSAGGHLASLAALSANDPAWQPRFEDRDTSVQACVSLYGVYDFTDRKGVGSKDLRGLLERFVFKQKFEDAREVFDRASSMSHVHAGAPPFFVIHGANDTLVPVAEGRLFVEMLRAVSKREVVYAELPGAQHAFEVFVSVRAAHASRSVERFLAYEYSRWLSEGT